MRLDSKGPALRGAWPSAGWLALRLACSWRYTQGNVPENSHVTRGAAGFGTVNAHAGELRASCARRRGVLSARALPQRFKNESRWRRGDASARNCSHQGRTTRKGTAAPRSLAPTRAFGRYARPLHAPVRFLYICTPQGTRAAAHLALLRTPACTAARCRVSGGLMPHAHVRASRVCRAHGICASRKSAARTQCCGSRALSGTPP